MMTAKEQQFLDAYETHADAIFRYCFYCTADRQKATVHTQQTFFKYWDCLGDESIAEPVRQFLYRSASLELIKFVEKTTLVKNENEERSEFLEVLKPFDHKSKAVIVLKYLEDFSPEQIAMILGEKEPVISASITALNMNIQQA